MYKMHTINSKISVYYFCVAEFLQTLFLWLQAPQIWLYTIFQSHLQEVKESQNAVFVLHVSISGLSLIPSEGKDTGNVESVNYMA